jgi:hypothetical protein
MHLFGHSSGNLQLIAEALQRFPPTYAESE